MRLTTLSYAVSLLSLDKSVLDLSSNRTVKLRYFWK